MQCPTINIKLPLKPGALFRDNMSAVLKMKSKTLKSLLSANLSNAALLTPFSYMENSISYHLNYTSTR